MKIRIPGKKEIKCLEGVEIEEAYLGVGFKTDYGHFGVSQRDFGLEIMVDGELVVSIQNGENGKYVEVYNGWDIRPKNGSVVRK